MPQLQRLLKTTVIHLLISILRKSTSNKPPGDSTKNPNLAAYTPRTTIRHGFKTCGSFSHPGTTALATRISKWARRISVHSLFISWLLILKTHADQDLHMRRRHYINQSKKSRNHMSGRALQIMWLQITFSEPKSLRSINSTNLGLTSVLDNERHFMSVYLLTSRKILRFQRNGITCWARSQDCEKRQPASSWLSVRPFVRKNTAPSERIFMKLSIFRKSVEKIHVSLKSYLKNGYFKWRSIYTLVISRSFLLTMQNVSAKVLKKIKTHFMFSNFFLNRALYEITWKNILQQDRPQMPIWRMRNAWWISKAINTHSTYVILNCFSITTMVAWMRLRVTLYVHCVSCLQYNIQWSCNTMFPEWHDFESKH